MAMFVSGSSSSTGSLARLELYSSAAVGSNVLTVDGTQGRLFSVIDEMSGSIFSANTIAGLPVIEAFSDNKVTLGPYSSPVIIDSSGNISGSSGGELNVYPGSTNYKGINIISDGSARPSLEFKNESQGDLGAIYGTGTDGGMHVFSYGPLSFMANSDEVIRIHSSGAVSIGDDYVATDPGGDKVIIEGDVGIGTASPDTTLEVDGTAMVSGSGLWFKSPEFGATDIGFKIVSRTLQIGEWGGIPGEIAFYTDDNLQWTVDDSGNFVSTHARIQTGTGTEASPAIQFASANDGFYHLASGDIGINVLVNNVQEALFRDGGDFHVDGDVIAYSTLTDSDYRLKTNITNISSSLDKVKKLRPVEFDWLVDRDSHEYGLIAQEVEEVLPMLVSEHNALGDTKKFLKELDGTEVSKTVDYSKLTVLLVGAMKEQQEQINELKTEIQEIKNGLSQ
jgi:hypothetical protein